MLGQRIGYIRVSSFDQNPERQLEGVQLDRIFTDKASGKDTKRPQLKAMMEFIREGDTVIVHSMDRLARNLDDLRRMVQDLTVKGISIQFVTENLVFSADKSNHTSNLMLSVMGAFAEFERAIIKERQREGIELAKKRGVYKGRKKSLSDDQIAHLKQLVASGERKTKLATKFGSRYLKQYARLSPDLDHIQHNQCQALVVLSCRQQDRL